MFGIGFQEMVFLAVIALLVFGPKRLPELARTLGRGLAEFRRASADLRGALSLEPDRPIVGPPPRRRPDASVDPREDRDLEPSPHQAGGGPDPAAAAAATLAELADEANDETHRDGPPEPDEDDAAAGTIGGKRAEARPEPDGERAEAKPESGGELAEAKPDSGGEPAEAKPARDGQAEPGGRRD